MKISELISLLQKYDPEMEIMVEDTDDEYYTGAKKILSVEEYEYPEGSNQESPVVMITVEQAYTEEDVDDWYSDDIEDPI